MIINVKCSNGAKVQVEADLQDTVERFKSEISKKLPDYPPESQRLVYQGRLLKDNDTLSASRVEAECTVHLVRKAQASVTPTPTPIQDFNMFDPNFIQQSMAQMQNPQFLELMSNPAFLQMLQNPAIQQMMQNPAMHQMLQNPAMNPMQAMQSTQTFEEQQTQLQIMGFTNQQKNLQALQITQGDVNAAVEWLLNNK